MIRHLRRIDSFGRNIIVVFLGASVSNVINLLYQLLIAHRLSPENFAAFNTLTAIIVLVASPLGTFQTVIAKYVSEFNILGETEKLQALIAEVLARLCIAAVLTLIVFYFVSFPLLAKLKISSGSVGQMLALILALSWLIPLFSGSLQGLESFKWLTGIGILIGLAKLLVAAVLLYLGYGIGGAIGAFMLSNLLAVLAPIWPLRKQLSAKTSSSGVDFKKIFTYVFPVALGLFCFMALVNLDMVLVRYFFSASDSGRYSIAQMVGKIFLFLPAAISVVMFPKTSGLNARNMDTFYILKRSLFYALFLCAAAVIFYNLFPALVLTVLTGKVLPQAIALGRLFSISMTLFTLVFILITYFLSVHDLRFLKYLLVFTILQIIEISLFHASLFSVQYILCINAAILLLIHLKLADFFTLSVKQKPQMEPSK